MGWISMNTFHSDSIHSRLVFLLQLLRARRWSLSSPRQIVATLVIARFSCRVGVL